MKITDIKTFLVDASASSAWATRNWLFVKVETDEGIYGLGEASGWPRVIQTAIADLTPMLIGEDPRRIERLWQKMLIAMMGHGMTGIVGSGAMTGIEIALWDILGKSLNTPVCDLLGGRVRDAIRVYAHASTVEHAEELVGPGLHRAQGWQSHAPRRDDAPASCGVGRCDRPVHRRSRPTVVQRAGRDPHRAGTGGV